MRSNTVAGRRYLKRFYPTMSAYVIALFGATWALRHYDPQGIALVVLSILPALPIIGVIGVMGLYLVEETDEYLRARIVTAMLVGLALMLSITSAWGFLENFRLVPHVYAYYAAVLWFAALGIGQCVRTLLARRAGE